MSQAPETALAVKAVYDELQKIVELDLPGGLLLNYCDHIGLTLDEDIPLQVGDVLMFTKSSMGIVAGLKGDDEVILQLERRGTQLNCVAVGPRDQTADVLLTLRFRGADLPWAEECAARVVHQTQLSDSDLEATLRLTAAANTTPSAPPCARS